MMIMTKTKTGAHRKSDQQLSNGNSAAMATAADATRVCDALFMSGNFV
jgi:hypothetical protein